MMQSGDPFHGAKWLTIPRGNQGIESAQWIWVQKPGQAKPTPQGAQPGTVRLVKEWTLAEEPDAARALFTADNSARLRINGEEVGRSNGWDRLADFEVRGKLKKGKNRIEVEATNDPGTNIVNPAGFILTASASLSNGLEATLASDGSWSSPDGSVTIIGGYSVEPWRKARTDVLAPLFRGAFSLGVPGSKVFIRRATARVIGLGHYDLSINGKRQGDSILNQPWSQYDKTIYWQEFEVTDALRQGNNLVEIQLGNSFYRVAQPPSGRYAKGDAMPDFSGENPYLLRAVIDITLVNGERVRAITDENWRWWVGPYSLSHIFAGEDYASRPTPNDGGGTKPIVVAPPRADLRKMDWPVVRKMDNWYAKEIKNPKPGVWTYVFPQNTSAILKFWVKGKAGDRVKFRPSEAMNERGESVQLNLHGGDASCTYTLSSDRAEESEWRFWYHGFQFVEVTGAVPAGKPNPDNLPVLQSVQMVHVRTDNPQIGEFHTSSDLYNRTHNLVDWAMRSNMSYVMSDCPQREKLGWQEQVHLLFPTFAYRYDCQAWFHKIARDIRDAQLPDGRFVTVAPDYLMLPPDNHYKFTVEWGASGVLMPWQAYQWYGDKRFLSENYEAMKRFTDWLSANSKDGLAPQGLGDWYDYGHGHGPGPSRFTPTDLTSTATWALCLDAVASSAEILGKKDDAQRLQAEHSRVRQAFLAKFYDASKKQFKNSGSVQAGHAMALYANLVPEKDRASVLQAIIEELEKRGYQQTAGDIGHLYFIRTLAEAGRSDVLHRVYSRTGVGSYGGILAKGLTAMPETWDAITAGSNSLNHCMLGHVMEWFYGWVLGIRQAPGSVGWNHILIAPEPGPLASAKGGTSTPLGPIKVEWEKTGHDFQATIEIPKGAKATVTLPVTTRILNVDGKPTRAKQGVFGRASVEVGPGKHVVKFDA